MSDYRAPVKDMRFVMDELAGFRELSQYPDFAEATTDMADAILEEAAKFTREVLAPLNHAITAACVEAERGMSRALAGSCQVPLGAFAQQEGDTLHITGFVASIDGKELLRESAQGPATKPEALGQALATKLIARGADRILAALAND